VPQTFTPKTWADEVAGNTPIIAAELNRLEQGVESMDTRGASLELGILTPVVVTYAASVSIDASTGSLFRITATGALTVAAISNGVDGQQVMVQVAASGADRIVTWSVGGVSTATVASGTTGTWTLRYYSTGAAWSLVSTSTGGAGYTDEQVRDVVGATLVQGANMTITVNDAGDTITLAAATSGAAGIPASIMDAKGDLPAGTANDTVARHPVGTDGQVLTASSAAGTGLLWAANTPADASVTDAKVAAGAAINADKTADGTTNKVYTATEKTKLAGVATGATANSTDATLLARGNHTGTQLADTLTDGTTNKAFLATERTKLTGIATGATANATDAQLRDRSTHTGTQAVGTVTGLAAVATSGSAADLSAGTMATARLGSGSASSATFLRGDQTWATPAGGASTVVVQLDPAAGMLRSTGFPALVQANGTTIPVRGLAFDATTLEAVFFRFRATSYGSGSLTVSLDWYADTASTNAVVWGAAIAAITPNTDSQDAETDALATASTTTTTHLGTTGQRLHRTTVTVSNLDSIAADDHVALQVYRDAANGSDTLAGDAILVAVSVSWSTT